MKRTARSGKIKYFTLDEIKRIRQVLSADREEIARSFGLVEESQHLVPLTDNFRSQGWGHLARGVVRASKEHDTSHLAETLDEALLLNRETELAFIIGLSLGTRVNELLSLQWGDVDFERRRVHIRGTKTRTADRICVMNDESWVKLAEYRDYIGKTHDKRTLVTIFDFKEKTANRRLKYLAKRANIPDDVWWHWLRHTHVIQSKRSGMDWDMIAQQTGDTPQTLMSEYSKNSIEDRQEAVEKTDWIPKTGD